MCACAEIIRLAFGANPVSGTKDNLLLCSHVPWNHFTAVILRAFAAEARHTGAEVRCLATCVATVPIPGAENKGSNPWTFDDGAGIVLFLSTAKLVASRRIGVVRDVAFGARPVPSSECPTHFSVINSFDDLAFLVLLSIARPALRAGREVGSLAVHANPVTWTEVRNPLVWLSWNNCAGGVLREIAFEALKATNVVDLLAHTTCPVPSTRHELKPLRRCLDDLT